MLIGLAVVGIAESRSQGWGIAELPVTTRHMTFLPDFVTGCCDAGSAPTLLFGSAIADAQNASASTAHAHRTDQPHLRLSLVFIALWIVISLRI